MNSIKNAKGSCLCGSVKLSFDVKDNHYHACHCEMCRKWGGGPLFSVDVEQNLNFEGKEFIGTFGSSEWAERGFCKQCGTHLFYRLKDGNYCNIPLGVLDQPEKFEFHLQVFTDKKLASYSFAEKTINMTGEELFAKFAP